MSNVNGSLNISWIFIHTGGIALNNISVTCYTTDELRNELTDTLVCDSNSCDTQSMSVGTVFAGYNYTCTVTATNTIGSDIRATNSIIATTGKQIYTVQVSTLFM